MRHRPGRRSSTRCWGPGASGTRGGRPSPRTPRSAAGVTTSRTPGSSTTSTPTAPSCTTWPRSSPRAPARPERRAVARETPERLAELIGLWFYEAGASHAFPLDDRSALEIILTPRPQLIPPRARYVYRPGTAEVPEFVAVNVRNRDFTIGALVDVPDAGARGV